MNPVPTSPLADDIATVPSGPVTGRDVCKLIILPVLFLMEVLLFFVVGFIGCCFCLCAFVCVCCFFRAGGVCFVCGLLCCCFLLLLLFFFGGGDE